MGKHSREESSDVSSDSERERKRSKSHKEKKEKKDKKHKKQSRKDKQRSRDKSPGDKERERLLKDAKRFLKQKLKAVKGKEALAAAELLGRHKGLEEEPPYTGDIQPISRDEYFQRNPEFSVWLREEKGKFFSQLDSEASHALFGEFVEQWNSGRLRAKYYSGAAASAGTGAGRSGYSWAFKGGTGAGPSSGIGMAAALDDELTMKEAAREQARAERKHERQRQQESTEEWLGPKPSGGREAMLEKKAARREAARAREDSPDQVRLPGGGDVFGGDSFEAAKAREARREDFRGRRQAAKQEELAAKAAALREAEDAKMAHFRALLAAGPIQIPKRQ